MLSFRKLPFWEKFSFGRQDVNALYQPNHSTNTHSYNYDSDRDCSVVITPAPDYDDRDNKKSKGYKQFWTMKGRSKNTKKRTGYSYESDNEKSQRRRRNHQCSPNTPKRHPRLSREQREELSDDSDWSFSSASTHNTIEYRKVEKRHRRRHRSSSDERWDSKSASWSGKKREREFESFSTNKREHDQGKHSQRKQVKYPRGRKGKGKCGSGKEHTRERKQDTGWDSNSSDSSVPEKMPDQSTRSRKQNKPKKGKKSLLSEVDDNWTIRQNAGNKSDGLLLKISMNDLKSVITENVLSAVKQGMDDDPTKYPLRHASPEILTTDTETLNSGYSAGSCNSTDALLPIISGRRMSSAFQPVPQRHSGIMKRFLPVQSSACSDTTGVQSRNSSVATIKSYISNSTTDPADIALAARTVGPMGSIGAASAHYDRVEDKLMVQTNALRGRHVQEPTGMMFDDDLPKQTIHHNLNTTFQNNQGYFQENRDNLSPRLSVDLPKEPVPGPCILQDANGRRMSVTINASQRGSLSGESDIQSNRHRRGSLHPDFDSHPNCYNSVNARRQSLCVDAGPLNVAENILPDQSYLARRRQSLPVNLTSYPYTDLASIGMDALMAATEAKVQSALKEKSGNEKCLSTVPEESVADSVEDKSIKADPPPKPKPVTKPSAELLKNIKQTAKEKKKVKVSKIMALLSSVLVLLAGVGVLGLGVLNMMDGEAKMFVDVTKKNPSDDNFQYYCYGLCFIGGSVVVVSLCSCVGALKVKTYLLKMVLGGLGLVLTLQVVMVTMVVVSQKDMPSIPLMAAVTDGVQTVVLDHLKSSLHDAYKPDTLVARAWDQLQVEMECCGCVSQDDYKYSAWWNATSDSKTKMPDSCCVVAVKDLDDLKPTNTFLCQSMTPGFWHETGCHDILMVWYKQNSVMAFGATAGLAALEIVCLVCTFRLYKVLSQKPTSTTSGTV
ncbi:uncharacterized protein [Argopecten irradians]|uniref:uncharacterized protein n=1 Tax=Argopecten irradians TaxID=31199 RepID=UPI0037234187